MCRRIVSIQPDPQPRPQNRCRYGHESDAHQVQEVQPNKGMVDAVEVREHYPVVRPIDSYKHETESVGDITPPLLGQEGE